LAHPSVTHDSLSPWTHISQGVASVLSSSPHTALPLSRVYVQVQGFTLPAGVNVSILAGASNAILRRAFVAAGMGEVMEPFIQLKIVVSDEQFGKVMKDLTEHGAEVMDLGMQSSTASTGEDAVPFSADGVYVPPAWMSPSSLASAAGTGATSSHSMKRSIHAVAPLSRMLDFSNRLRALSGGHGTFEMSSVGFRAVDQARSLEILRELGRA